MDETMTGSAIERLDVRVFQVPTARQPETDGTAQWSATTMVLVESRAGGQLGIGYSYIHGAAAQLVSDLLAPCVVGASPFAIPAIDGRMMRAIRNDGRSGIAACAISAVDVSLWDLKARLLG